MGMQISLLIRSVVFPLLPLSGTFSVPCHGVWGLAKLSETLPWWHCCLCEWSHSWSCFETTLFVYYSWQERRETRWHLLLVLIFFGLGFERVVDSFCRVYPLVFCSESWLDYFFFFLNTRFHCCRCHDLCSLFIVPWYSRLGWNMLSCHVH